MRSQSIRQPKRAKKENYHLRFSFVVSFGFSVGFAGGFLEWVVSGWVGWADGWVGGLGVLLFLAPWYVVLGTTAKCRCAVDCDWFCRGK